MRSNRQTLLPISTSTLINGPTPNGGSFSLLHWKDNNGCPTDQNHAAQVEIIEYDQAGSELSRMHANLGSCQWLALDA